MINWMFSKDLSTLMKAKCHPFVVSFVRYEKKKKNQELKISFGVVEVVKERGDRRRVKWRRCEETDRSGRERRKNGTQVRD